MQLGNARYRLCTATSSPDKNQLSSDYKKGHLEVCDSKCPAKPKQRGPERSHSGQGWDSALNPSDLVVDLLIEHWEFGHLRTKLQSLSGPSFRSLASLGSILRDKSQVCWVRENDNRSLKSQLSLVAPPHRPKGESPNLGSGPGIPHERYRSKDMAAPAHSWRFPSISIYFLRLLHACLGNTAIIAPLSSMNLIAPMVNMKVMNVLLSFNKWIVTRLLSEVCGKCHQNLAVPTPPNHLGTNPNLVDHLGNLGLAFQYILSISGWRC